MTEPQNPAADAVAMWKKLTDEYLGRLGQTLTAARASGATEAMLGEAERAYVEIQGLMKTASQKAYAPVVEAFGAVPVTEFQRLQDQVHTILLRLDRIDDVLREVKSGLERETPRKAKKKDKTRGATGA